MTNVNGIKVSAYNTIDHYPIEDGMKVWDYDLVPVIIDLHDQVFMVEEETNQNTGTKELWFCVWTWEEAPKRKLMSAKRVWVRHPSTGKRAEPVAKVHREGV